MPEPRRRRYPSARAIHVGAWSLAFSRPRTARSTPAAHEPRGEGRARGAGGRGASRRSAPSGSAGSPRRCRAPRRPGCSARSASVQPCASSRRVGRPRLGLGQRVVVVGAGRIDVARLGRDVVVAGEHHRHARRDQPGGVGVEPLHPRELVVELRPRLRVAVRRVERGDEHAPHRRLDVARLAVVRVAGQRVARQDRLRAAGEDGDAVPRPLPAPDRAVARRLQRRRAGSRARAALSSCRQTTSGSASASQSSRLREPLDHAVDVEGRDLQSRAGPVPHPRRDGRHRLGRADAGHALARPEVVVAVLDPEDLDRRRQRVARHLLPRPEGVARALHDQRRRRQPLEVRGAQLRRLARRVERVAEAEQPRDLALGVQPVRDHARDPPAHRLAADDERRARPERRDGGDVLRHHRLRPRRPALAAGAPRRHVAELEARDPQARRRQRPRRRRHRRRVHRRPGAMGEQHPHRRVLRSVEEEVRSLARPAAPRSAPPAPPSAPTRSRGRARDSAPTTAAPRRACPPRTRARRGCRPRRRSPGRRAIARA